MDTKIKISNTLSDISHAVETVEKILKDRKVKPECSMKAALTLEETTRKITAIIWQ